MTLRTSLVAVWYSSDFCELFRARLHFLEQSRVLDGDDRLVRESLEQRYLLLRKWFHNQTTKQEAPNCLVLSQEWDCKRRPVAELTRKIATQGKLVSSSGQIVHMDRLSINDSPAGDPLASNWVKSVEMHTQRAVMRCCTQVLAMPELDRHVVSTQAACYTRNRVKHGPKVEFRAVNDAENFPVAV